MTSSHLLKALKPYMFSLDAMQESFSLKKDKNNAKTIVESHNNKITNQFVSKCNKPVASSSASSSTIKDNLWIPQDCDKLFWCVYYLWKSDHEYIESRKHAFSVENEIKIAAIEKLRNSIDILKSYGLKLCDVENDLVNTKRIGYKGLCGLCIAFGINIIYVKNRTYMDLSQLVHDNSCIGIIVSQNGKTGIKTNENGDIVTLSTEIQLIKDTHYLITDPNKPIKAISAYKLSNLTDIAMKLNIDLHISNGKLKRKKELYEDIVRHL